MTLYKEEAKSKQTKRVWADILIVLHNSEFIVLLLRISMVL